MELSQVLKEFNMEESDIEIWYSGLKRVNKNRFFTVNDSVVVELTRSKYMICSWDEKTFDILMNCIFCTNEYAMTNVYVEVNEEMKYKSKNFHQLYLDYEHGQVADHINRNKYDNRATNLRIVTVSDNNRNRTTRADNTSGLTGLHFHKRSWAARISKDDGKRIWKSFSCKKYGYEEAKQMAINWRKQKKEELNYLGE